MVISVNSRGTLTLPSDIRKKLKIKEGDHFDIDVQGGQIIITPVMIIPKIELSAKGHLKEKEATEQIKAGKKKTFKTAKQLIEELNAV